MGPVKVFVLLAAISGVLGSDESLKPKPWSTKLQDVLNSMDLPKLKSAKENDFVMKPVNESWENLGSGDSVRFIMEKNGSDCGSYSLSPGQSVDIQSTNFPENYPQNDGCTWTFEASSPNSTISINCNSFKLKNCMFSSLQITGGNLNKTFCGNKKKGIQASSSNNQMKVDFKSKMITSQGFQCTVSASGTTRKTRSCVQCGTVNRITRIVGGVETVVNEFPWQVAIVYPETIGLICGGVIYNDLFIMTAAHCVDKIKRERVYPDVLLGAHNLVYPTSTQQRIRVVDSARLIQYDPSTADNDFGIMLLGTAATFNDYVKPACLPNPYQDYSRYTAIASGWGDTGGGSQSNVLLKAQLKILWNYDCVSYHYTTWNMICAVSLPQGYWQTCGGDSGGPLVVYENGRGVVVGLTSFRLSEQCPTYYPTFFTRVSRYLDILASLPDSGQSNMCQ